MYIQHVLQILCPLLNISFIWPQVWRVRGNNSVEGISAIGTLHGFASMTLWATYGIFSLDPTLIIGNTSVWFGFLLLTRALVKNFVISTYTAIITGLIFITLAISSGLINHKFLGWIAIVVGATNVLPQTFASLKQKDSSGIATSTYILIICSAFCWSIYGLLKPDIILVIPNLFIIPCSLIVVIKTRHNEKNKMIVITS